MSAMDDGNKVGVETRKRLIAVLKGSSCQVILCSTADKVPAKKGLAEFTTAHQFSSPAIHGTSQVREL